MRAAGVSQGRPEPAARIAGRLDGRVIVRATVTRLEPGGLLTICWCSECEARRMRPRPPRLRCPAAASLLCQLCPGCLASGAFYLRPTDQMRREP